MSVGLRVRQFPRSGKPRAVKSWSPNDCGWMHVLALAIPLTRLLTCSNLCASAFARGCRFILNASPDWQPLGARLPCHHLVVFAHGFGFPFTDATSHELGAVGFSDIA